MHEIISQGNELPEKRTKCQLHQDSSLGRKVLPVPEYVYKIYNLYTQSGDRTVLSFVD